MRLDWRTWGRRLLASSHPLALLLLFGVPSVALLVLANLIPRDDKSSLALAAIVVLVLQGWRFSPYIEREPFRIPRGVTHEKDSFSWWALWVRARVRGEIWCPLKSAEGVHIQMAHEMSWAGRERTWGVARLLISGQALAGLDLEALAAAVDASTSPMPRAEESLEALPVGKRIRVRLARLRQQPGPSRPVRQPLAWQLREGVVRVTVAPDFCQVTHDGNPTPLDLYEILEAVAAVAHRGPQVPQGAGYRGASSPARSGDLLATAAEIAAAEAAWKAFPKRPRNRSRA
jgi:hypothetical protein